MKSVNLLLAFALGFVFVVAVGRGADATGRHAGNARASLRLSRINILRNRVKYLEQQASAGKLTRKVVAPFEVVNRAGKRIFYVGTDREVELCQGGKRVAVMSPAGGFGSLWVLGKDASQSATLTPRGFNLNENGQTTASLGKDEKGKNYRLVFSSGDKLIAAIGVSSVTKGGIALVADGSGSQKADMAAGDYGTVEVERGYGHTVARLTESNGGYFIACSAQGCDPAMVEAGDDDGVGVVRTGPLFYNQGPTGAPGSYLKGQK